jgi:outer membrane protein assembly factor BamA
VFADTILKLNSKFSVTSTPSYFTLFYHYEIEHRDYKTYPLRGYYLSVELEKKGLGILKNEQPDILTIKASFRKYWELDDRLFFAAGVFGKYCRTREPAYYTEQGLGYGSETIRSMEYYVVDGENFGLVKTQLKYQLLKTHIIHLKFLPLSKFNSIPVAFFVNLYYDGGYISENRQGLQSDLANRYLYGGGVGIDFVTYYDQVIRLDYSVNMMLEHGFFLHFTAPF